MNLDFRNSDIRIAGFGSIHYLNGRYSANKNGFPWSVQFNTVSDYTNAKETMTQLLGSGGEMYRGRRRMQWHVNREQVWVNGYQHTVYFRNLNSLKQGLLHYILAEEYESA
jgi:hypothetical protein